MRSPQAARDLRGEWIHYGGASQESLLQSAPSKDKDSAPVVGALTAVQKEGRNSSAAARPLLGQNSWQDKT